MILFEKYVIRPFFHAFFVYFFLIMFNLGKKHTLLLLTFAYVCATIYNVYAHCIIFAEDVMDDGDGETCHSMKIICVCQA